MAGKWWKPLGHLFNRTRGTVNQQMYPTWLLSLLGQWFVRVLQHLWKVNTVRTTGRNVNFLESKALLCDEEKVQIRLRPFLYICYKILKATLVFRWNCLAFTHIPLLQNETSLLIRDHLWIKTLAQVRCFFCQKFSKLTAVPATFFFIQQSRFWRSPR